MPVRALMPESSTEVIVDEPEKSGVAVDTSRLRGSRVVLNPSPTMLFNVVELVRL